MLLPLLLLLQRTVELPASFDLLPRPGATNENGREMAVICGRDPRPSAETLLAEEFLLADSIVWTKEVPETWRTLGCLRAMLSTSDAHERESVMMLGGTSWAQGAANALLREARLHPLDSRTLDLLALLQLRENFGGSANDIRDILVHAVDHGVRSAPVLRACTQEATRKHDAALVRRCTTAAIGIDSN